MAVIVATASNKGGVSKTTTTYTTSWELAKKGLKVLMIDLDPQANLTVLSGKSPKAIECSIANVLVSYTTKNKVPLKNAILNVANNLDIVPSVIDLSATDSYLHSSVSREFVLKKAIKDVLGDYDVIMIDCQPSLSLLPLNALTCCTHVLIPCSTDYLSYCGLEQIEETIDMVRENLNEDIKVIGVLATKAEMTTHSKEILQHLKNNYNVIGVIPKSVKVSDAAYSDTGSVTESDPESKPALAYKEFAEKLADMIKNNEDSIPSIKGDEEK